METISKPEVISLNKFREDCNAVKYGSGHNSKFIIYYGYSDYKYKYKIRPFSNRYVRADVGINNKNKCIKEAYRLLFESENEIERDSLISEGEYKIAICY